MKFPTLHAFIIGNLSTLWLSRRDAIAAADPALSPIRAGEIAAAQLSTAYWQEAESLEFFIRASNTNGKADDVLNDLYDAWQACRRQQSTDDILIELSGTRTLLWDKKEGEPR